MRSVRWCQFVLVVVLGMLCVLGMGVWGCIPKGQGVKSAVRSNRSVSRVKVAAKSAAFACIRGRVVGEDGKGVPYVFVTTVPTTTPAVTDRNGVFEFCYVRKAKDGSMASIKVPLKPQTYTILVKKDGYKAKPVKVQYKGKGISLAEIKLIEKTIKPVEIKTKGKDKAEQKEPPGGLGTWPKES